jgi:hypothetical protein
MSDTTREVVTCAVKVPAELLQDKPIEILEKERRKKIKKKCVGFWISRRNASGASSLLM